MIEVHVLAFMLIDQTDITIVLLKSQIPCHLVQNESIDDKFRIIGDGILMQTID